MSSPSANPKARIADHVTDDFARGRREGLRLALAVLAVEEEKWARQLGQSRSWRTNATREIRHKTLQVAQKRLQTALNRLQPASREVALDEIGSALAKLGL
ncbi:hypothetical protein [Sphingomonas crocodyli]|uniref:Uncharacterized protein n=1 Tax=Sphingomonas crocodyli TaxID=1979270 RepID=A0A437LYC6_9SPHN|nr:hypothetical protein [Sphingomonas crocodyli]RVT90387.1 hypothetical protein EOD43_19170 [Sphingomonas crocodyli]